MEAVDYVPHCPIVGLRREQNYMHVFNLLSSPGILALDHHVMIVEVKFEECRGLCQEIIDIRILDGKCK